MFRCSNKDTIKLIQIDPGSKIQEQPLHKKKILRFRVVAHLLSIAGIKVWKVRTDLNNNLIFIEETFSCTCGFEKDIKD